MSHKDAALFIIHLNGSGMQASCIVFACFNNLFHSSWVSPRPSSTASSVSDAVFEISVRPDTANCLNRVSSPLVEGPNAPVKIVSVQGLSASVVIAGPLVRRTGRYRASRTVGLAAWSKFLRNACESPMDASFWLVRIAASDTSATTRDVLCCH